MRSYWEGTSLRLFLPQGYRGVCRKATIYLYRTTGKGTSRKACLENPEPFLGDFLFWDSFPAPWLPNIRPVSEHPLRRTQLLQMMEKGKEKVAEVRVCHNTVKDARTRQTSIHHKAAKCMLRELGSYLLACMRQALGFF